MGFLQRQAAGNGPDFTIVLRGYERQLVDKVIAQIQSSPAGTVEVPKFPIALRGYERRQVDAYMREHAGR